jgi:hypothetical protein
MRSRHMIAAQSPDAVVVRGAAGTTGWPLAHAFSNRGAVALLAWPEKGCEIGART